MNLRHYNKDLFVKLPKIQVKNQILSSSIVPNRRYFEISLPNKNFSYMKIKKPFNSHTRCEIEVLQNKYLKEKEIVSKRIERIQKRILLIKELQTKFKIKFTQSELKALTEENLEKVARNKYLKAKQIKSYHKIANWWKRSLILKKMKKQNTIIQNASTKIQRWWRRFLIRRQQKIERYFLLQKMNNGAKKIQAEFRGFIIRKKLGNRLIMKKLSRDFRFFSEMKQQVLQQALKNIIEIWKNIKIKKNYLHFYDKIKAHDKQTIFHLLKKGPVSKSISKKINKILTKNQEPIKLQKNFSKPASPQKPFLKKSRSECHL